MIRLKTILESRYVILIAIVLSLILGYIISLNRPYLDIDSMECIIKSIKINNNKLSIVTDKILINYYMNDIDELEIIKNTYRVGDTIYIEGTLTTPNDNTNFNLFNYRLYLRSKKIYYVFKASNIKLIKHSDNIFYIIKNKIIDRIEKNSNREYLYAFILGDTNYIDDNVITSYQSNGVSHLFSISGMHVSLLSLTILFILNKVKKRNSNYIIVIIFLIYYSFLTNYTPSIMRSTLLFVLLFLNKSFKLDIKTYILFIYLVCGFIIYNIYLIYNVGFLFSFSISFFLILYSDIINNRSYFIKLLLTSLVAFLVSIPIMINNFYSINLLSPILNLFFVPFISYIIFPLSFISFILPILEPILSIMITILEFISVHLTYLNTSLILCHIPYYLIIFYYILIIFILEMMKNNKFKYIILIYLALFIHSNYINLNDEVHLIDVGQGDSILVRFKYNQNILIDTGGMISYGDDFKRSNYSVTKSITIPYLKSLGIKKLDYLILTHGDYDHMGDSINLVNNFKVDNVILNNDNYNDLESELIKVLDNKEIRYYKGYDSININNNSLVFLNTNIYNNENDNSNVVYLELNNYKFLFMGDAGVNREKDIIEKYNLKDIYFLKVGHHGSNTSSSEYFINNINPKYSLISVGKNNRYGHPKNSVLNILSNSKIYRTDKDGSIEIKLNKSGYKIRKCML